MKLGLSAVLAGGGPIWGFRPADTPDMTTSLTSVSLRRLQVMQQRPAGTPTLGIKREATARTERQLARLGYRVWHEYRLASRAG